MNQKMYKYHGVVIGGIADGHVIGRDDPQIVIKAMQKMPSTVRVAQLDGETTDILMREERYNFLLLFGNTNAEIGVWALPDWPIERVILRLVSCYNPRTGLIGTPAPNALPIQAG